MRGAIQMSKKLVFWLVSLTLPIFIFMGITVLTQPAKADSKFIDSPEPCTCSHESLLTMSNGLQQKLEDVSGRSFKGGEKFLNSIYGSLFNCSCGKIRCVVTSTTRGLNSISCVNKGLF